MFRHLWLIFAQTVTVCIALWFVVATLRPGWLTLRPATTTTSSNAGTVTVAQVPDPTPGLLDPIRQASYSDAA
ncbi:MAG TPA: 2-alkenal reductase, partial [Burkholderiales bacterium]|nr:2-alkenal reductase [Burkholderiales bacterium]